MQATRFTDFIQAHVEKSDPNRIFLNKTEIKRIMSDCGAPQPQTLQQGATPADLDFNSAPARFVVKATEFSSKKGIYPLFRVTGDTYLNLFTGKTTNAVEIIDELTALIANSRNRVIMEEFVTGENGEAAIPFDYKFYTFDGEVKFIVQIDRNVTPGGVAFFDGRFDAISDERVRIDTEYSSPSAPARPANWEDMIHLARKVSHYLNRPFISVDMYTSGTRAYVGELTPTPGGPYYGALFYFSSQFDVELGEYWRRGCVRRGWPIPEISSFPPCRRRQLGPAPY